MDGDGIQEYIPINSQDKKIPEIGSEQSKDSKSEDALLTISDLTKKFSVSRQKLLTSFAGTIKYHLKISKYGKTKKGHTSIKGDSHKR